MFVVILVIQVSFFFSTNRIWTIYLKTLEIVCNKARLLLKQNNPKMMMMMMEVNLPLVAVVVCRACVVASLV